MTLDTKHGEGWTVYIRRAHWVVASETESGLSQPSDSDWQGRAKKHPAKEFAKEAETRNEGNTIDLVYDRVSRRFGLSAKGPLAMAVLAIAAVAFLFFVFYGKG